MVFLFSSDCLVSFNRLKEALISAPIMESPDWNLPFEIMCDDSDYTVGAVLHQGKDKKLHAICYASKTLDEAQTNCTTTEKELLALVYAFEFLVGRNFDSHMFECSCNSLPQFRFNPEYIRQWHCHSYWRRQ